ncbi:MAG: chorismate mutase [Clostridia bacterium]|nr:chorismate mutase [Clostridia bacterium]
MEDNKLLIAREIIDKTDKEMAQLFVQRMEAARLVAEYKMEHGLPIKDKAREELIIQRNAGYLSEEDELVKGFYVNFMREVIDISCKYQGRLFNGMKVAYCGINGAFASIAAGKVFPDAQRIGYSSFTEAYDAVVNGECDTAVLPIENSSAGDVGEVCDMLFSGPLCVNATFDLSVTHDLLVIPGTDISQITRVVSHPQALMQCGKYIEKQGWEVCEYVNTALAAKYVAELGDKHTAAIASEEAASLYGLEVLQKEINESKYNTTRFAVLSAVPAVNKGRGMDKRFILMFTVRNEAGKLAEAVDVIGKHGYNMQSLRSRPMKELLWQYYFFVEAEGDIHSENGKALLEELSRCCDKLKLVGSFSHISQ